MATEDLLLMYDAFSNQSEVHHKPNRATLLLYCHTVNLFYFGNSYFHDVNEPQTVTEVALLSVEVIRY